jgi:hypothetical protein
LLSNKLCKLTSRSKILLEKLTVPQLVTKWNLEVHYRIHEGPSHVYILSQISSVHAKHPTSSTYVLILSSQLRLGFSSGLFHLGSPAIIRYLHLLSPIRATCPAHLILLDLITRIIYDKEYSSHRSSASILLHSRVISSLFSQISSSAPHFRTLLA